MIPFGNYLKFVALFGTFGLAVFVPQATFARDMMGVVDRTGNCIVPCQYKNIRSLDLGFFLCEGFNSGPGACFLDAGKPVLANVPKRALEAISKYAIRSPKLLLNRDGKAVKLSIPKGTCLADVYILPTHLLGYNDWRKTNTKDAPALPEDTLLAVMGPDGFGVCDLNGKYLIEPKYHSLSLGGIASGKITVSMWDEQRERLIQSVPEVAESIKNHYQKQVEGTSVSNAIPSLFREGLAVFRDESRLFGYKDPNGKIVIPAMYYSARPFSEGIAAVRLNPYQGPEEGKECYIDRANKIVSPIFWRALPFHGKLAMVAEKGSPPVYGNGPRLDRYGLIDRKFNYFLKPVRCTIEHLKQGYWVVQEHGKPALVLDAEGKEVFRTPEPAYVLNRDELPLSFFTSSAGRKRILFYDLSGKLLKEVVGEVERHGTKPIVVRTSENYLDGTRGVIDTNGNWLIKPSNVELCVVDWDRIIKKEHGTEFVKEDWDSMADRGSNFENFLKQHVLIGMKRSEVESFLGKGTELRSELNIVSYIVGGMGSTCGNAYTFVHLQYESGCVKRWRHSDSFGQKDWIE